MNCGVLKASRQKDVNLFPAVFPSLSVSPSVLCLLGFPCGSAGKESACNAGDLGLIPGLGGTPGEGKGYPLQYSGLENPIDCVVHGCRVRHD